MDIIERIWEAMGEVDGKPSAIYLGRREKDDVVYYMITHGMVPPGAIVQAANRIHNVDVFYVDTNTHFKVV